MATKVRKQIYLEQRQNKQLKRLAEARGVSEAEVIRGLIDAQATGGASTPLPPDRAAWEAILEFSRQRAQSGVTGEPYKWNRDDAYEERLSRFGPLVNNAETSEPSLAKAPTQPTRKAQTRRKKAPRRGISAK